jgi:hypothetical protein
MANTSGVIAMKKAYIKIISPFSLVNLNMAASNNDTNAIAKEL